MKIRTIGWLFLLALFVTSPVLWAQENSAPQKDSQAAVSKATETEKKNVREYIDLMRENVEQQKAEIMGAVMQLNASEAAKFWPIYDEYNTEMRKLNDLRLANIKSYASSYLQMDDQKADDLANQGFSFQRQRADLLAKYYERMKQALGATTASRFLQVENQLLSIIDLQIDSRLPIVRQGS